MIKLQAVSNELYGIAVGICAIIVAVAQLSEGFWKRNLRGKKRPDYKTWAIVIGSIVSVLLLFGQNSKTERDQKLAENIADSTRIASEKKIDSMRKTIDTLLTYIQKIKPLAPEKLPAATLETITGTWLSDLNSTGDTLDVLYALANSGPGVALKVDWESTLILKAKNSDYKVANEIGPKTNKITNFFISPGKQASRKVKLDCGRNGAFTNTDTIYLAMKYNWLNPPFGISSPIEQYFIWTKSSQWGLLVDGELRMKLAKFYKSISP